MSITQTTDRAERLVKLLPDAGVDLMLVTDLVNVRYLTAFTGSNGLAVVGPETRKFATDFRYLTQVEQQVDRSFDRRELPRDWISGIQELLPDGPVRLGFEASQLPVSIHSRLVERLPDRIELVATSGLIERLRAVKEAGELQRMRAASALADSALEQLLSEGLVGRTEREAALALELTMRRSGADRVSFEPVIAAGPNGALPHAEPRDVEIGRNEIVVIDWGAQLEGYCSDCTRTVATGEPSDEAKQVYELVLEAQLAGMRAVRAGTRCRAVDAAARDLIKAAGYGENFGHGLGHGVGLAIHEDPRLTQNAEGTLEVANTVTVEPGVYLPGSFGVRIEDLVAVTEQGCDSMTSLTKDLTVTD
ncbi:MAG TPA: Xaa-Pro peptidase family protein [Solirubrobacteraceae bacterium]|nr:Xaa-Pro peptidase family protein [Solirubrobacteraceae bacterium]